MINQSFKGNNGDGNPFKQKNQFPNRLSYDKKKNNKGLVLVS